jgi:hypothetical protein
MVDGFGLAYLLFSASCLLYYKCLHTKSTRFTGALALTQLLVKPEGLALAYLFNRRVRTKVLSVAKESRLKFNRSIFLIKQPTRLV